MYHFAFTFKIEPSDVQAIYRNKLTQEGGVCECVCVCVEGGGWSFGLYHDFPNRLHIKDEALASKQLLVNLLLFISESSFN